MSHRSLFEIVICYCDLIHTIMHFTDNKHDYNVDVCTSNENMQPPHFTLTIEDIESK